MTDFETEIHAMAEKYKKREEDREKTEWGRLINRIESDGKTDDEWLQLQEDVRSYVKTNPPQEDLDKLMWYAESLGMRCNGIRLRREGGLKNKTSEGD